ncbi:MAG: preprotein translocase subunit SecA [Pirellulales bacterium]
MTSRSAFATAMRLFGPKAGRPRATDRAFVDQVRAEVEPLSRLSNTGLRGQAASLRRQAAAGLILRDESLLASAFAVVVEAARRTLGIELYDVQLLGGLALARGSIAEMQTGEGKTFTVLLPACIHALAGQGVHVMTVNAYLAARDFEQLLPVYQLLGFSAGLIDADADESAKRAAYACDITYGPGYEFGFDYLRDQMAIIGRRQPALGEGFRRQLRGHALPAPRPMQRGHAAAILDEADSVMLDEATTPLLLSSSGGTPAANADVYRAAAQAAARLVLDRHYTIDAPAETLRLTAEGFRALAQQPGSVPTRGLERPWPAYIEQALRAAWLYRPDVHYIVADDEIRLVDRHTGRIFADRTWRDGLHQAVQVQAGVTITSETKPMARITRQRYLRLYPRRCGMTGTARDAERELRDLYGLNVVVIPPHKTCLRITLPIRVFAHQAAKERAVLDSVVEMHRTRRPVLVGTASIETSQRLAAMLELARIPHQLLNGKQDEEEAAIVAGAGKQGTVTIATNMAGRGTDIKLGPGVAELGGLHVIATEPQESARIDRQLVGRSARQGDPGSCQMFAAADDNLLARHAPALAHKLRQSANIEGEAPASLAREITEIQRRVDRQQAELRRRLFDHDDWLEEVLNDLASSR